jgi:hypothetical protein
MSAGSGAGSIGVSPGTMISPGSGRVGLAKIGPDGGVGFGASGLDSPSLKAGLSLGITSGAGGSFSAV